MQTYIFVVVLRIELKTGQQKSPKYKKDPVIVIFGVFLKCLRGIFEFFGVIYEFF
jgi:hypothetical protein